jgi:hypothetical protein
MITVKEYHDATKRAFERTTPTVTYSEAVVDILNDIMRPKLNRLFNELRCGAGITIDLWARRETGYATGGDGLLVPGPELEEEDETARIRGLSYELIRAVGERAARREAGECACRCGWFGPQPSAASCPLCPACGAATHGTAMPRTPE